MIDWEKIAEQLFLDLANAKSTEETRTLVTWALEGAYNRGQAETCTFMNEGDIDIEELARRIMARAGYINFAAWGSRNISLKELESVIREEVDHESLH